MQGAQGESKTMDEQDDRANESSSSQSSGPPPASGESGSGSGQGYIADWSSSESSSEQSSSNHKGTTPAHLNIGGLTLHEAAKARRRASAVDEDEKRSEHSKSGKHQARQQEQILEDLVRRSGLDLSQPPSVKDRATLPQWNGVRIQHPMDPRIDLSTVGYVNTDIVCEDQHSLPQQETAEEVPARFEHYFTLMEAVRPFFEFYSGEPAQQQQPSNAAAAAGCSDATQAANSDNRPKDGQQQPSGAVAAPSLGSLADESDTSSMRVLARVKRRHKRRHEQDESHEGHAEEQQDVRGEAQVISRVADERPGGGEALPEESSRSTASTRSAQPQAPHHPQPEDDIRADLQRFPVPAPPQFVSESSDNVARQSQSGFSSTGNTGTTNTSGSGSGGNSGSNNNSSGSGNENSGSCTNSGNNSGNNNSSGSGNEGKSGEKCVQDGHSKGVETTVQQAVETIADGDVMKPPSALARSSVHPQRNVRPAPTLPQKLLPSEVDSVREKKLLHKKRKRMNMRREYEEQVQRQLESSDSSEGYSDIILRPGQACALDEVLSFSKNARMIIQAFPPYLVVHANAAYTGLTGVDSHAVVGQPVTGTVSLLPPSSFTTGPPKEEQRTPLEQQHAAPPVRPTKMLFDASSVASPAATGTGGGWPGSNDMSLERLIVGSGFGDYHVVNVAAKSLETSSSLDVGSKKQESRESSLSSEAPSYALHTIQCRVCISPVVSSVAPDEAGIVTDFGDKEDSPVDNNAGHHHASKRPKHHHDDKDFVESQHRHFPSHITHYVIQLELFVPESAEKQDETRQSFVPKDFGRVDALVAPEHQAADDMQEDAAESSDRTETVTAIG